MWPDAWKNWYETQDVSRKEDFLNFDKEGGLSQSHSVSETQFCCYDV